MRMPVLRRFKERDGSVVAVWLLSRISVFVAATYSTWILAGSPSAFTNPDTAIPTFGPIATWHRWDLDWYASVATAGYGSPGVENNFAFLPGFPSLLWSMAKVGIHPTLAGLGISVVAGLVAALALGRLTKIVGGRSEWGVLAWVLAPAAVYLAAPYTESLFCALAFSAWLMARRARWAYAALLAGGACLVRINGLFLAVGLVVLLVTSRPQRWRSLGWLSVPFLTLAAVFAWFHSGTGSWTAWSDAQAQGWHRHLTNPLGTLQNTIDIAYNQGVSATFSVQYRFEIAFVAIVLALTVVMFVMKWWAEATYMLITLVSLATSTEYYSVPRATLVLFPIWMLAGLAMSRWRGFRWTYIAVCTPLMFMGVMAFTDGRWVA